MTSPANPAQSEAWNGESGERWVASADQRDRILAPVADALLAAAELTAGLRVLDIGCGCGVTTLQAADLVGSRGSATGIDLSKPMLDVAQRRAKLAGARTANFVHGDAQTYAFPPESVDVVIGRFGTMFFSDPVAAFANIREALRPGGRLCVATWQPLAANKWLVVPGAALLRHTELPAEAGDGPGMFAQSDPHIVTTTLEAAGYTNVVLDPVDVTLTLGATVDEAVEYLVDSGPGRALLDTIPTDSARDDAIDDVRATLTSYVNEVGVGLCGAVWVIAARR
jgi:SAM-dependent methyltransferase